MGLFTNFKPLSTGIANQPSPLRRVFLRRFTNLDNAHMTDRTDVQTGRQAAEVLDNPAFKEAMQVLRETVVQQWREHPIHDKEGALILLQYAKVTDRFEGVLSGLIERGKLAQHRIEVDALRDEDALQRAKRRFVG